MAQAAKVINFAERYSVISGKTNTGSTNVMHDDMKKSKWVDPIYNIEEMDSVEEYLNNRIFCASSPNIRQIQLRNKLMFMFGTRTGFRVSDLKRFTWKLIFDENGEFWTNEQIKEEVKTGKTKSVILTDEMKLIIKKYIKESGIEIKRDNYIFISNKVLYELYNIPESETGVIDDVNIGMKTSKAEFKKAKHRGLTKKELELKVRDLKRSDIKYSVRRFCISEKGIRDVIKDIAEKCDLKGNFAGRSLRKTYAYRTYTHGLEKGMSEFEAVYKVKDFLNHRDISDTTRYIGIKQKKDFEFMNDCIWSNLPNTDNVLT